MEIDWSALQQTAKAGSAMPDGDYDAIIVEATATTSSNGKPMIKTKWRIIGGPYEKRAVSSNFTISAESSVALRIFFDQMALLGLDTDFFAASPKPDDVAAALLNRGAHLTLGQREWQGATLNEIKRIAPLVLTGPPPPGLVVGPAKYGATSGSSASPMSTPSVPSGPPVPSTPAAPTTPTIGAMPAAPPATSPPTPAF
jgi:hypothetical protein